MRDKIISVFEKALKELNIENTVELTESKGHADFATNVAMKNAKAYGKSPLELAKAIIEKIGDVSFIDKLEIAGPGFINITLKSDSLASSVETILKEGENFGKGKQGKYINIEYVSANPTGYLHLGHARNAAVGTTLANALRFAGNKVDTEYYINDAGNQMEILGMSTFIRYQELCGKKVSLPEDSYRGAEIIEAAQICLDKWGDQYKDAKLEDVMMKFSLEAETYMLEKIKEHLKLMDVEIELYYSEREVHKGDTIMNALKKIPTLYEADGATWIRTTKYGDDKDRVVIKSDGHYTYFAPDIAYHSIKLSRGYDEIIDVWGGDHIGYVPRMRIALQELGLPSNRLDILTIQMVRLVKDGQEFKMSKRKGQTFTLLDLIELVGKDAARYFLVSRSNTTGFDFDINEATEQSSKNPVYTLQYAHARANQLLQKSSKKPKPGNYEGKEIEIINQLMAFPKLIEDVANTHKVHLISIYLQELTQLFNSFYSNSKIIDNEREESLLALVQAVKQVLKTGLTLIGVSAPDKM